MKDEENYKRPLADHETRRSSIFTAAIVIILALTLPVLMVPEEEEPVVEEVIQTANVPQLENPEQAPPPDSLDPFGDYAPQDNSWSIAGMLEAIKHFILNYTVFGFIYQNVDETKVKSSFSDLKEKAKPIRERKER